MTPARPKPPVQQPFAPAADAAQPVPDAPVQDVAAPVSPVHDLQRDLARRLSVPQANAVTAMATARWPGPSSVWAASFAGAALAGALLAASGARPVTSGQGQVIAVAEACAGLAQAGPQDACTTQPV